MANRLAWRYDKIKTMSAHIDPMDMAPSTAQNVLGDGALAMDAIASLPAIRHALRQVPHLQLAIVFGSCANGTQKPDSDLDIAVALDQVMGVQQHIDMIASLALATGRPIDLIDLRTVGEPLLGQIMQHGLRILGSDVLHAQYMVRHVMDAADFMPYQARILQERRQAWIGK
jgi:predicted nucleotidyltransferase